MSADPYAAAAEIARRVKAETVRSVPPDADADLRTSVYFIRAGIVIGQILVGHGPNAARESAGTAAMLFRCDAVLLVSDSYQRLATTDEADTVKHGEMAEDWAAGRRDGITEAIMALRIPSDGDATIEAWPYIRDGKHLTWSHHETGADKIEGPVVEYAQDGFAAGAAKWDQIKAVMRGVVGEMMDEPMAELHADRASARLASQRLDGSIVVLHEPEGARCYVAGEWIEGTP